MPSVYDPDNYAGRVNYAATVIARQGTRTRHFDTCFEMRDGSEVAVALYRRSLCNPRLAANLWHYIGQTSTMEAVARLKDVPTRGLAAAAAETRRQRQQEAEAFMTARADARNVHRSHETPPELAAVILPELERLIAEGGDQTG